MVETGHQVVEEAIVPVDPGQLLAHLLEHLVDLAIGEKPDHVQVAGPAVEPEPLIEGVGQFEVLACFQVDGLGPLVEGHHLIDALVVFPPEVLYPGRNALLELERRSSRSCSVVKSVPS